MKGGSSLWVKFNPHNWVALNACGHIVSKCAYDTVHYGSMDSGYRQLCTRCFNAEVAELRGLDDFENIRLEPIGLTDCASEEHQFHFQTRLLGGIVSLEAFEPREGNPAGYTFQLSGKPEEDLFALLGPLIQRIRKALSVKHIEDGPHGLQIVDDTVRGRIEWDEDEDGRVPLMVVDGREISPNRNLTGLFVGLLNCWHGHCLNLRRWIHLLTAERSEP